MINTLIKCAFFFLVLADLSKKWLDCIQQWTDSLNLIQPTGKYFYSLFVHFVSFDCSLIKPDIIAENNRVPSRANVNSLTSISSNLNLNQKVVAAWIRDFVKIRYWMNETQDNRENDFSSMLFFYFSH